jgi:hypothetical protein
VISPEKGPEGMFAVLGRPTDLANDVTHDRHDKPAIKGSWFRANDITHDRHDKPATKGSWFRVEDLVLMMFFLAFGV